MWLEAARQRLNEGRLAAALEELIDAWRARRLPQLADVIDLLSARLEPALPPIRGRNRKLLHEAWLNVANERRPIDLERLLTAFSTQPWTCVGERIERLASVDDPRVTRTFAAFFHALPTVGGVSTAQWGALFGRLRSSADVRVRQRLVDRLAMADGRVVLTEHLLPQARRVLDELPVMTATPDELTALHELSEQIDLVTKKLPSAEALLGDRARVVSAQSEEELLSIIYQTPEDDAPRLVYSDWLQERGDPRATVLLLQLEPRQTQKRRAEARRLVKQHGRQWMGVLEPAIAVRTEAFERGFLASGQVRFATAHLRAHVMGRPEWNTLTELRCSDQADPAFVERNELRGLERLGGLTEDHAGALQARATPLRRLRALQGWNVSLEVLARIDSRLVPRLEAIDLGVAPVDQRAFERALASPPAIFEALRSIKLTWVQRREVFEALTRLPALEHVELTGHIGLRFHRRGREWVLDLVPSAWSLAVLEPTVRDYLPLVSGVMELDAGWKQHLDSVKLRLEAAHTIRWVPRG